MGRGEGGAEDAAAEVPEDLADTELDADRLLAAVTLLDFESLLSRDTWLIVAVDVVSAAAFFFLPKKNRKPMAARCRERRRRRVADVADGGKAERLEELGVKEGWYLFRRSLWS